MKMTLWRSEIMGDITVDLPQVPRRGELFTIGEAEYKVEEVIFEVAAEEADDVEEPRDCRVKLILFPLTKQEIENLNQKLAKK
jgi:hypothetical protein